MREGKKAAPRVLIGPVEIAGIADGLARGFSEIGVRARVVLSAPHPFRYGIAHDLWLLAVWRWIGAFRTRISRERWLLKALAVLVHSLWGWLVFLYAVASFDAFVFLYGQTITNTGFELWLLRSLNKKIIFIYVGSDVRPPYIDGGWFPDVGREPDIARAYKLAQQYKRKLRLHERYSDYLVNSPSTAQYHERRYVNWFSMGIPKCIVPLQPAHTKYLDEVNVLHCPSNPVVKGSAEIRAIVERLKAKGIPIRLTLIEGEPNETVLRELAQCDLVVDQLYSDTPLAVFATEAAFFGKPAVVGGYFADEIGTLLGPGDLPPSLFVPPEKVEAAIERLVTDHALRCQLGERARAFVTERWAAAEVAGRYLRLLTDDVPASWWCDPKSVRYVCGCGMPKRLSSHLVAALIRRYGVASLQVADKPELEEAFLRFAASDPGDACA